MARHNVLIIGSGGREHALAWSLSRSPLLENLFIAPGNPGTAALGENIPLSPGDFSDTASYFEAVAALVGEKQIGLTVVGPEQPLVDGITDFLEARGCKVFGPSKGAARLEGSKTFAKWLMHKYKIPTAESIEFTGETALDDAEAWLKYDNGRWPAVIKADGLAAGKGVFISSDAEEAAEHIRLIREDASLRKAADRLIIEEFMVGEEASVFAITDGRNARLLLSAQDHKRIGEGDTGLNTGGMGAYAPAPVVDDYVLKLVEDTILYPTLGAMQLEGHAYRGVLYLGLMITEEGPKVVEYNCRFGDPECQALLPAMESDLLEVMLATVNFELEETEVRMSRDHYCCVVMASGGYPGAYEKGKEISGIGQVSEDALVFQSGTREEGGRLLTNGGRVLSVVAAGPDLTRAISRCYKEVEKISFDGAYYRRDIGKKGLNR
ncbi:phosphoribosylamine--glycine ligase [Natronogracilivirga saccharolytica]|uniref:Phosphoribosylamine--glycine ligase n=1 Tax=Natronogracilivirga saccharolytica TaxID=2812953 RepID=A0A8J7RMP5_9BACT|nr:phosphoribosylamine--glycine ligase [Natronogracilivirga saccharolytica]MBP3192559.1 phosphoribosylamine--glycine ligase [Natronogracilivirga saccharolytica]